MNVDAARSSSVVSSDSETSSSSGESLDEFHRNILQGGEVLGYQFEPTQQKTHNLFWPDENSIEQCFAAHIVQGC